MSTKSAQVNSRTKSNNKIEEGYFVRNCKNRINKALNGSYKYTSLPVPRSNKFLRSHVYEKHPMYVVFVDMVGSTKMSSSLSTEELTAIIKSFCQEMAYIIEGFNGHVLKFVGDAVLGYFVEDEKGLYPLANNVTNCCNTMISVIKKAINPALKENNFPQIKVKIGIDRGEASIILYSNDIRKAHIDIIGLTLNLAAKMQSLAKPNQIVIGENVYDELSPRLKRSFRKMNVDTRKWNYDFGDKGIYPIFAGI